MFSSSLCHCICRVSQEISNLEDEVLTLRSLLRTRAAVERNLVVHGWRWNIAETKVSDANVLCYGGDDPDPSEHERRAHSLPDVLDVLLAERKVDQAIAALDEGEKLVHEGYSCTHNEGDMTPVTPVTAAFLQVALSEKRARLVEYLIHVSQEPFVHGMELRSAITGLVRLGEGMHAHTLLLHSHDGSLQHNIQGLVPIGTLYGGAFTAALSQMVFSAIAQATSHLFLMFLILRKEQHGDKNTTQFSEESSSFNQYC